MLNCAWGEIELVFTVACEIDEKNPSGKGEGWRRRAKKGQKRYNPFTTTNNHHQYQFTVALRMVVPAFPVPAVKAEKSMDSTSSVPPSISHACHTIRFETHEKR